MTDDLVAQPEEPKLLAGTPLDSGAGLLGEFRAGLGGDWDAIGMTVSAGTASLDTLGVALDPLGGAIQAGVGWLLEHIAFLREPIEVLTGDPAQIKAVRQTWDNVAQELVEAADAYDDALATVASWGGSAAAAYREVAGDCIGGVRGSALQARSLAQGVSMAGILIATERALIFQAITEFVGNLVRRALVAVASSVVTLGGSVAAFISSAIAQATAFASRISTRLARLLQVIAQVARKFGQMSQGVRRAGGSALERSAAIRRNAGRVVHDPAVRVAGRAAKGLNEFEGEPEPKDDEGQG